MATLGGLSVSLEANIVRFTEAMDRAAAITEKNMGQIDRSLTRMAKNAAITFAGAFALDKLLDMTSGVIKATAALDDMARKTGASVESLSAFAAVAKLGGNDIGTVENALIKLAKGMAGASETTKGAGLALATLGVNAKDSLGNLRPTSDVMLDIAKKLEGYAEGAGKAAIAQELFGKSGAQVLPFLHDMVKFGDQVTKTTAEQAEMAKNYEENLVRLGNTKKSVVKIITLELLPVLDGVVTTMLKASNETGGLKDSVKKLAQEGTIRDWGEQGALAVATLVDGLKNVGAVALAVASSIAVVTMDLGYLAAKGAALVARGAGSSLAPMLDGAAQQAGLARDAMLDQANKRWDDLLNRRTDSTRKALEEQFKLQHEIEKQEKDNWDLQGKAVLNFDSAAGVAQVNNLREIEAAQRKLNQVYGQALGIDSAYFTEFEALTKLYQSGMMNVDDYRDAVLKALMAHSQWGKAMQVSQDAHVAAYDQYTKNVAAANQMVTALEEEFAASQKGNVEREITTRLLELERKGIVKGSEEYNTLADRIRSVVLAQEDMRSTVSIWSQLGDLAAGFGQALINGPKAAIDYLRNSLKSLLAEMIAIFAKRWILSLGASLTSGAASAALSSAAGQTGTGSIAGGLLSAGGSYLFGSAASGGAAYAGYGMAAEYAMGAGTAATSGLMGSGGLMATLGTIGPVGWAAIAVLAIAAVATAFRDKGENWQGRLAFGSGAQAYTTEGIFGREGFAFIQGQDATNRAIQEFMAATKPLDQQLAGRLSSAQIDAIRASLAGPYSTRNDGQPATFAFGKEDGTAAQQLTLEYLQKKYGTIFDQIDTTFAEWIRSYTGKSEDLLKAIGEFAGLLDALDASGIKGLNIETLRAFQRQGEALGDTFARISKGWSEFQNAFLTDAEKLQMTQDMVSSVFGTLGIAVPDSMQAFKELVKGLDLSTEAGRNMFEALMAIAPGFAAVANAAATAMASLMSTAGQLNPAFASGNARSGLVASVEAWRGLGDHGNWTVDQTIAQIGNLAHDQAALTAAIAYAQSLGGNAVGTLNQMLQSYIAWQGSMNTSAGAVSGLAGSAASAGSSLDNFASQLTDANRGLLDWINKTMLNPALSPLSPAQQFLEAQKQYQSVLASARGGDLVARGNLDDVAQTVLEFARQQFGSNADYTAFYRTIIGEVGGVAGMTPADVNAKLFGALPENGKLMTEQTGVSIASGLQQILALFAAGITTNDPRVAAAVEDVATNLKSATNSGAFS